MNLSDATWAGFRDLNYVKTYGVYEAGSVLEIEALFDVRDAHWRVLRLEWLPHSAEPSYVELDITTQVVSTFRLNILIPNREPSGACLIVADFHSRRAAQVIIVNGQDSTQNVDVVVVRPVFTEWGYHRNGFYWNERRRIPDRILGSLTRSIPGSGRLLFPLREACPRLFKYPYKNPANDAISLDRFYETNPRWLPAGGWAACDYSFQSSAMSSCQEHGTWAGMWTEDIKSTLPTFSLLQKAGLKFRTCTDVDMHTLNRELSLAPAILFYAQELITKEYLANLETMLSKNQRVIFFGVQGIGYKEVQYDTENCVLRFLGEKGTECGLSGETTNGVLPSWDRRDAEIFGFEFPVPRSNWRKMARKLRIIEPDHWLVRGLSRELTYEVRDRDGKLVPGLTWAGGEYFVKATDVALLIAVMDETELAGFGVCGSLIILSPTYWPSFGFYQHDAHPEIVEILRRSVLEFA